MAQNQGVAGLSLSFEDLYRCACQTIGTAQAAARLLLREGIIPPPEAHRAAEPGGEGK